MFSKHILYDWNGLNLWLFCSINTVSGPAYDQFMLLGTALADRHQFFLYLLLICIVAIYALKRKTLSHNDRIRTSQLWKKVILVFVLAYGADFLFLECMKYYFHYPRPFVTLPPVMVHIIGKHLPETDYYKSFPSGHASFAALLVASLWPVLPRLSKPIACAFVFWVCWSRIALGAHYPADVLTGTISSIMIVLLVSYILGKLRIGMLTHKPTH